MHIEKPIGKQGMVVLPATILARVGVVNGVSEIACEYKRGSTRYVYTMYMTRDFTLEERVEKVFPMKIVDYVLGTDVYLVEIAGQQVEVAREQIIGISEEE